MPIASYQPDIPQNVGSLLRLSACLGQKLHVIEPCGFLLDDKRLRRVAMDYADIATLARHSSWEAFLRWREEQSEKPRLLLLSTRAEQVYTECDFTPGDILLLGRESSGVPDAVREACDGALRIPLSPGARSLNVALAAAIVAGEMMRQVRMREDE